MPSAEGKKSDGKLVVNRQMQSIRNKEDDRDRISELPNNILVHIMEFMETKDAVTTCVLSKRWKNLWKDLTSLTFNSSFSTRLYFDKFVSGVLSNRDGSTSLLNVDIIIKRITDLELLNYITGYAVLHNVQHFSISIHLHYRFHYVFPESLQLPALKSLHLENVCFRARHNDFAEPFSSCISLNSLVLKDCSLHKYAKVLCIDNSNLESVHLSLSSVDAYKIVFSTPNLSSLTVENFRPDHQLSFTHASFQFLK